MTIDRREFLGVAGMAGIVYASGLRAAWAKEPAKAARAEDFYFVQMSDTHWGFAGEEVNPDASGTLAKAVTAVNALEHRPDFVVFTGDLTHTTDDPAERRRRMAEFHSIVSGLKVPAIRYLPGEHDASLDAGAAFSEIFGPTRYAFDHKGIHFIALDNVSDPGARLGDEQLAWLETDLGRQAKDAEIVVFAHRPLFDLYPQWDWSTRDGARAIELLQRHERVTVFYGHIHQEHHQQTGAIAHHAAKSLIFPLPAPGAAPKRAPIRWDVAHPYLGLGLRQIGATARSHTLSSVEFPPNRSEG